MNRKKSRRRSPKARPENEIQKATAMMKKANAKARRARGGATPDEEAVMAQHAELVREAGATSVVSTIETGKRLLRAKEAISHGGWMTFIDKHLKWEHSTVAAFMKIGRAFGGQSSEVIRTLPGNQRMLVDLARLPATGLKQLVAKHKGSLASVSRVDLRADIRGLLPATTRRPGAAKAGPRPAKSSSLASRRESGADDPAFSDPLWVAGNLLALVSRRGVTLTDEERNLILQKLDEIRAELEAPAVTVDIEGESPTKEGLGDDAVEVDEEDRESEDDEAEPDRDQVAVDESEAAQDDDAGDEEPHSRYRRLKDCVPLTPEEFAKLRPSAHDVVARGADGSPYRRRHDAHSIDNIVWENAPTSASAPTAASAARASAKGVKLKGLPSGGGKVVKLAAPEGAPRRRAGAR